MSTEAENLKRQMASKCSAMMIQMLDAASVPYDVQLEAALVTLGALFVRNVKSDRVRGLFQRSIKKVRDTMETSLVEIEKEAKKNARH